MGNYKIEIEAVGGHGCDRNAKQGEAIAYKPTADHGSCPDCLAKAFLDDLAKSNSIINARLTHWPDTSPIVDDLKAGVRAARDFSQEWQGEPILQFFAFSHLGDTLREISRPFAHAAYAIVATLPRNAERTVALRKLLEAKDAAVRAAIAK